MHLVEVRGIEPLSEIISPQTSTSVCHRLNFPTENSDDRKLTDGSFINAGLPQSLSNPVAYANRRVGRPDLMTLIAGRTGDSRVNVAPLGSLQRIISCV